VGEGARVLRELARTELLDVLDPLHRRGALIGREGLIAKTVKPSLRHSWNQSRQVIRLPVQLWKYSWATTLSMRS
jgi:hypothetical protein